MTVGTVDYSPSLYIYMALTTFRLTSACLETCGGEERQYTNPSTEAPVLRHACSQVCGADAAG